MWKIEENGEIGRGEKKGEREMVCEIASILFSVGQLVRSSIDSQSVACELASVTGTLFLSDSGNLIESVIPKKVEVFFFFFSFFFWFRFTEIHIPSS